MSQSQETKPAIEPLGALLGLWDMVGTHPLIPSGVRGRTSFEWLEKAVLLVMRSDLEQPGPPNTVIPSPPYGRSQVTAHPGSMIWN